jgi:hypothetical protein
LPNILPRVGLAAASRNKDRSAPTFVVEKIAVIG